MGRAAIAATIISIGSGVVLGTFEIQGWHMPTWLAVLLIALAVISIASAVFLLLHELWAWLRIRIAKYGLCWPFYDKTKVDPNQWLLDIADHGAREPHAYLSILRQKISNIYLSPKLERRRIVIELTILNRNVHTILVGPPKGHMKFNGNQLGTPVENTGRARIVAGDTTGFTLTQYLKPEVAKEFYDKEVSVPVPNGVRRLVRTFYLGDVGIEVTSEPDRGNGGTGSYPLRLADTDLYIGD